MFVKLVEPVNTSGLPFLLAFNLKKVHVYLLVTLQKRQPHLCLCFKTSKTISRTLLD